MDIKKKCCKCEPYETGYIEACKDRSNCLYGSIQWDDKFGLIEVGKKEFNMKNKKAIISQGYNTLTEKCSSKPDTSSVSRIIEGVGEDAEIVTNAAGGKQSKSPMAMHLVDPEYLEEVFKDLAERGEDCCTEGHSIYMNKDRHNCCQAIEYIASYMRTGADIELICAMDCLCDDEIQQVINIAKILQYGAEKYTPNNWRLIPEEEHINHALIHIIAHLIGDTQDDHINHALCRLMMAKATSKSPNFTYGAYVA